MSAGSVTAVMRRTGAAQRRRYLKCRGRSPSDLHLGPNAKVNYDALMSKGPTDRVRQAGMKRRCSLLRIGMWWRG